MADTTVTDKLQVLGAEAQVPELPGPNAVEIGQEKAQLLHDRAITVGNLNHNSECGQDVTLSW